MSEKSASTFIEMDNVLTLPRVFFGHKMSRWLVIDVPASHADDPVWIPEVDINNQIVFQKRLKNRSHIGL